MEKESNSNLPVKRENYVFKIIKIFWIFLIGSLIGYIIETIVGIIQNGHLVSRQGLLYGPFIQVYGIGLVVYYIVMSKIENKNNIKIFLISMILGGIVEYLFSYFQEKLFGTISWDYNTLLFNINGRTSLLHCMYWGLGGILFIKFIYPIVNKFDYLYKSSCFKFVTVILILFMIFNITMSGLVGARQLERKNNIAANSYMDIFFDKYYPDEKLKAIYSNVKTVNN